MWKTSSFCSVDGCIEVGFWEESSFSFSNGNCVEVGAFRKSSKSALYDCIEVGAVRSSFCQAEACLEASVSVVSSFSNHKGSCVEASATGHVVAVRDTKDREIEPVVFSLGRWTMFIEELKASAHPLVDGVDEYRIGHLKFNRGEWDAFLKGVVNLDDNGRGEFDLSPELEAELASV